MNLADARRSAREIFDHALKAADARAATQRAISVSGPQLTICKSDFDLSSRNVYAVAIGKAAPAMASGLSAVLGSRLKQGVLTGPGLNAAGVVAPERWLLFRGGHPIPNQQSLAAADAAFELLERANDEGALVIFLISGGGSAMMERPRSTDITLSDLQQANQVLVSCGATIAEINSVRAAISEVKAGGLAKRAPNCEQVTLLVSDTNEGDERSVASGPTFAGVDLRSQALEVVQKYELESRLPGAVTTALHTASDLKSASGPRRRMHHVLLSNLTALEAAAEKAGQLGFVTKTAFDLQEQSIEAGCRTLLDEAAKLFESEGKRPVCLVSGGEFSCPVKGDGVGGRNSETVLRCILEVDRRGLQRQRIVIMSAGTDGIDGNSPAAGAIADDTALARAKKNGLKAETFLTNSDAFTFFDRLGDAVITGATGTNVRDLRILMMFTDQKDI